MVNLPLMNSGQYMAAANGTKKIVRGVMTIFHATVFGVSLKMDRMLGVSVRFAA
jgi:hypothetical protein